MGISAGPLFASLRNSQHWAFRLALILCFRSEMWEISALLQPDDRQLGDDAARDAQGERQPSAQLDGLECGVASMQVGERALLTCEPDWAHAALGVPGHVPPDSAVCCLCGCPSGQVLASVRRWP